MTVPLALGGSAITAMFDLEAQILSLLLDDSLMHPDNFADQYDIFTGKATGPNLHYGKIHTGDSWEPACKHFCGDDYPNNMPVGLIVFGDTPSKKAYTAAERPGEYYRKNNFG